MEKFLNFVDNLIMRRMFLVVGIITAINAVTLITPTAGALLASKLDARSYVVNILFRALFFILLAQLGLC